MSAESASGAYTGPFMGGVNPAPVRGRSGEGGASGDVSEAPSRRHWLSREEIITGTAKVLAVLRTLPRAMPFWHSRGPAGARPAILRLVEAVERNRRMASKVAPSTSTAAGGGGTASGTGSAHLGGGPLGGPGVKFPCSLLGNPGQLVCFDGLYVGSLLNEAEAPDIRSLELDAWRALTISLAIFDVAKYMRTGGRWPLQVIDLMMVGPMAQLTFQRFFETRVAEPMPVSTSLKQLEALSIASCACSWQWLLLQVHLFAESWYY
jgi:hypothetical protein